MVRYKETMVLAVVILVILAMQALPVDAKTKSDEARALERIALALEGKCR